MIRCDTCGTTCNVSRHKRLARCYDCRWALDLERRRRYDAERGELREARARKRRQADQRYMHDQAPRIIAELRQRLGTYERVADVARVSTATVLKWRVNPPKYMHRDAFRRLTDAYAMIQRETT